MGMLCCDTNRENRRRSTPIVAKWPEPREGDVCDVDFRDFAGKIEFVTGAMLAMTRRRLAEAEVHPVSR